jgi:ABC-2 type transport system ATP-binding protein
MRCDKVALIQNGKILSVDMPGKIKEGFSRKLFSVKAVNKYKLIKVLRKYPNTLTVWPFGDSVHLTVNEDNPEESLLSFLINEGIDNPSIEVAEAGIEDRFLELMDKTITA